MNTFSSEATTVPGIYLKTETRRAGKPQVVNGKLARFKPWDLIHSWPFIAFHIYTLFCVIWYPFKWQYLALCVGTYYLRMFAITGGYHRYFSHRSYKTNRVMQFLIAFLGGTSAQKGALWWAANHRLHHKHSDTEQDIHSPIQRGFWWSHVGWIVSDVHDETCWDQIPDFAKFPELRWLNRWHLIPPILFGSFIFFVFGFHAFVWGFLVSTVLLWHGTFSINSLMHVWGTRRYESGDMSRNNLLLALVTMGEGWHNNHHAYMSSTCQGFYWYEVDFSYYLIRALSWVGLTHDLRKPPLALLEGRRVKRPKQKKLERVA